MGPDGVVLPSPAFNEYLGCESCVELLACQQLIAELAVAALDVAFSQGQPGSMRLHAEAREPLSNLGRGELRAIVTAQTSRHAPTHEQIAQSLQNILALEASRHVDLFVINRQARLGVFSGPIFIHPELKHSLLR